MDETIRNIVDELDQLSKARSCQRAAQISGDESAEDKWLEQAENAKYRLYVLLKELINDQPTM